MLTAGLLLPDIESLGSNCAIVCGGDLVPAWMKVTMDKCVSGREFLSLFRRFKSLHLAFPTSCRAVRVFRAVV